MNRDFEVGVKLTADSKGLVGESRAARDAIGGIGDATRKAGSELANFATQTERQASSLSSLKTGIVAAAGAYLSLGAAMEGGKAIIATALANERLNNTLKVGTGSAEAAAKEIAFLREESDKLGLQFTTTADQYAKLSAAAKGTKLEGQATRDIFLAVAKASTVMGLSSEQSGGALLALQQMISKGKVSAEELTGQLGERLPGALQIAARAMDMTTAELLDMMQKGELTAERLLPALAQELEKTFGAQAQDAAQGLNAKINRLDNSFADLKTAIGNTGLLDLLSSGIVLATRFVDALSGAKVLSAVDAQKQKISEMREELESLGNRKHIPLIGDLLFDKKQADLLSQRIDDGIQDLKKLEQSAQESAEALSGKKAITPGTKPELPKEFKDALEKQANDRKKASDAAARETERAIESSQKYAAALQLEADQIGKTIAQKKLLSAATEAAKAPTKELAMEIMASAQAFALAADKEEALKLAEKDRLETIREIEKSEKEAAKASEDSARKAAQEWNHTWSGVEQTAKSAFIQFAAHGKSAMQSIGESIKLSIIDLLYQLTARKWMINIGAALGGMGGTGAASAGGFDLMGATNLGSLALNLAKSGFGTTSLIGSGLSKLGSLVNSSSLSAFGGGFAGDAIGGLAAGGFSSGAASAASMGASVAAFAGPAIAIAAVDQIVRMLAGDKMIGGGVGKVLNFVPVLGPMLNGLFGRGPLKQRETSLTGLIGADGFESGALQTDFRAKGGLFRSDKNDFARIDAVTGAVSTDNDKLQGFADQLSDYARDTLGLINDTAKQTSASLRQVGQDLGLSTDGLESFRHEINLVSEKGKLLTEEQIGQEIATITDALARKLIPEVDNLAKRGETAIQTVGRLGTEFNTLVNVAATLLGKTVADSRALVSGVSFEGRTAFIDNAGGVDALTQKAAFFAQNFLTEAERLAPVQEELAAGLQKLGLSSDLTKEQFKSLVQSYGQVNGVSAETLQALLNLAPAFVQVRDAVKSTIAELTVNDAFAALQKSVEAERTKISDRYNTEIEKTSKRIQEVSESVGKLKNLSDALKSTISALRPLSRDQAKQQIQDAINAAKSGRGLPEADSLREALNVLGKSSTSGFKSSFEFAREQTKTANLLGQLGTLTDTQLSVEERSLKALENQRDKLEQGFKDEMARLDAILAQGQGQFDAMNGLNTSILSLTAALGQLNLKLLEGGGAGVVDPATGGVPVGGTSGERGNLINKFINSAGRTPEEIYAASVKYGVTAEELDSQSKYTLKEINDWIDSKGLKRLSGVPGFASGGFHRGGLRIVGERGPELEATGPSRISSNHDLAKMLRNDDLTHLLKDVVVEMKAVREFSRRTANKLDAVTRGGNKLRTESL